MCNFTEAVTIAVNLQNRALTRYMAKLLKISAAVTTRVDKVIGSRAAAARYGKNSKAKRVTGTITATNGRGVDEEVNAVDVGVDEEVNVVDVGVDEEVNAVDVGVDEEVNVVDVGVDEEVNAVDVGVDEEVNAVDVGVDEEVNAVDVGVDEEVNVVDVGVDEEVNAVDVGVDEEVNAVDVGVDEEMNADRERMLFIWRKWVLNLCHGKPKGVGVELKDAACAETKVIIALQIQEGREAMASKEYVDQYTKAGTAVVLRLTQPWHGSGDKGLHFTGLVKKATTMFPKKYFDMQEYVNDGSSETLTASIDGNTFIAHCWADTTRKYFISTHNTTLDGNPHGKKRWREIDDNEEHGTEVVYQYTKRTRLVYDYFAAASVIDISNHARQSGLALETAWVTQHWDHRVISTILGIIAFHMWQHFHPQGKDYSHADFTEEVAYRLLTSEEPSAIADYTVAFSLKNILSSFVVHYIGMECCLAVLPVKALCCILDNLPVKALCRILDNLPVKALCRILDNLPVKALCCILDNKRVVLREVTVNDALIERKRFF
ncbi:hypothetical protein EMCRGX_G027096 [Ephydatia muelleri]